MDRSERVGYLVLEAALIALGVLLALAAESWWSGREERVRAESALAAISGEMKRNAAVLLPTIAYHDTLARAFPADDSAFRSWDDG